jgi:flagellar biosynthesis chaperone FliJ
VTKRVNDKRQIFIEEMQKRKNMLALMERHREAIKPLDQRMDEFKLA